MFWFLGSFFQRGYRMCWVSCLLCSAHWHWVYLGYRSLTQSMQLLTTESILDWEVISSLDRITWKWLERPVINQGAEVGLSGGPILYLSSISSHGKAPCPLTLPGKPALSSLCLLHSTPLLWAHSEESHLHSPKLQVWTRMHLLSNLYLLDLILSPHPKATFQV